jgi:hypothetical protein
MDTTIYRREAVGAIPDAISDFASPPASFYDGGVLELKISPGA